MKRFAAWVLMFTMVAVTFACTPSHKFHKSDLPDPKSFNAHFGDMDTDGNDMVDWKEFKAFFKDADPNVFEALDLNRDKGVDHHEWHAFKEAHGLKHKE